MSEIRGKMELDERVFELLAESLYDDQRAFVRELIQNAYDAGSTKVDIEVNPDKIIVQDNGRGMSYNFMTTDFKRVGKRFKEEGKAGVYGIGRLSCWLVSDRVKITSNDGSDTTEFDWMNIKDFEARKIFDKMNRGTRYELTLKTKLDAKEIEKYVIENSYVPVEVSLNGAVVNTHKLTGHSYEGIAKDSSDKDKHFKFYYDPDAKELTVLEKGFKILSSKYGVGGIVDFSDSVKVLSREGMHVKDTELRDAVFDVFVKNVLPRMSKSELERNTQNILAAAYDTSTYYYRDKLKDLKPYLIFDGKSLSEIEKEVDKQKIVLVSGSKVDTKASRAVRKGYTVLVASDYRASYILGNLGYRKIEEVPTDELSETVIHNKPKDKVQLAALEESKNILESAREALIELQEEYAKKTAEDKAQSGGEVRHAEAIKEASEKLAEIEESQPIRDKIVDERSEVEKEAFAVSGINLAFGKHEDKDVAAWHVGNTISFNTDNDFIQTILATRRFDRLVELVTHEFCHTLGHRQHDEDFVSTYNAILQKIYSKEARLHPAKRSVSKGSRVAQVCRLCGKEVPFGGKHEHLIKEHGFPRGTFTGKYFGLKGSGLEAKGKMPDYEFGKKESIKPTRGVDYV